MPERRPVDFRLDADRLDLDWYGRENPDLVDPNADSGSLFRHHLEFGAREGRRPNDGFSPEWYLERYPKVRTAITEGRLAGAFHDYLLRIGQDVRRRAGPATAIVAATLTGADPLLVATLLRLAERAPGWEFWLVAPPGSLPPDPAAANLRFVATVEELPAIDLRIGIGGGATPSGASVDLPSLLETLGPACSERSADALDRVLEHLRERLIAECPVIPAGRRDSGPVHVDVGRVAGLRVSTRQAGGHAATASAVLEAAGRVIAEIPPSADGTATVVDIDGSCALWITLSLGLAVDFAPAPPPVAALDVILTALPGSDIAAWRRSIEAAAMLCPHAGLLLAAPPPGLDPPAGAVVLPTRAAALAAADRPALLVPAGVALFPQAAGRALEMIIAGTDVAVVGSAMRHSDRHLAIRSAGSLAGDRDHARRWARASVTVLSAGARRLRAQVPDAAAPLRDVANAALGAVDASAWPKRLKVRPELAPDWLRLDCRPDGAVLGRLRLRGPRFAEAGRIVIHGSTADALAEPCQVQAVVLRRGARDLPIAGITLPASGGFAWPINLPAGLRSTDTLLITPLDRWMTAQDTVDPRPVLFRLQSVRYRPDGEISPRAASRER